MIIKSCSNELLFEPSLRNMKAIMQKKELNSRTNFNKYLYNKRPIDSDQ